MSADLSCPVCGAELDMTVLFAHEHDQRALARLATVSIPMGARVLQYLTLFTPPKTRLTAARKIKLILQLLPDLERKAITVKGRDWDAPLSVWAQAIDQMLAARDSYKLELPMKGHGYLYAVMAGMANNFEAAAEKKREDERRTGPRPATTNGPTNVADLAAARPAPAAAPRTYPQTSTGMSPTVRAMREKVAGNKATQKGAI